MATPNTCSAGPGYHALASNHWFFGLFTQAPIGHRSVNRIQRIQFMSLQPELMHWSDLIPSKAFDPERNAFCQQFDNNWECIFSPKYVVFLSQGKILEKIYFPLFLYFAKHFKDIGQLLWQVTFSIISPNTSDPNRFVKLLRTRSGQRSQSPV